MEVLGPLIRVGIALFRNVHHIHCRRIYLRL